MSDSKEVAAPIVVPVLQRVIVWDEGGLPQLVAEPVLTKTHIRQAYFLIAAQPFVCDDPLDPDFGKYDGMTIAEVLVRKQLMGAASSGDPKQIEDAMDRLIDKPISRGENLNVNASYEQYLKGLAAKLAGVSPTIDVTPSTNLFGDLE